MGRQLSYRIVRPGFKIPQEEDYDNIRDYDTAYYDYLNQFDNIEGSINSWDGPRSYDNDIFYTRSQMMENLKDYIEYVNLDTEDFRCDMNFRFTVNAFAEIISYMASDDLVIIKYL